MGKLLPFEAYYESSSGKRMCLSEYPIVITNSNLFDSIWKLTSSTRPLSEGGRLIGKRRPCSEKEMELSVAARSPAELSLMLEKLSELFDSDVQKEIAGRLWINGRYLRCWCAMSQKELSHNFASMAKLVIRITPEYPTWHTDRVYQLLAGETDDPDDGHSYDYSYPKRYGNTLGSMLVSNTSVTGAPMKIVFFGPAENPRVFVSGREIGIDTTLTNGEYAVIDQLERSVYSVTKDGERINCFDKRVKNGLCFEYAEPGNSKVELADAAGTVITITEQRSEPQWALN